MQGEHYMKAKAEICVMQLQAKELPRFPSKSPDAPSRPPKEPTLLIP